MQPLASRPLQVVSVTRMAAAVVLLTNALGASAVAFMVPVAEFLDAATLEDVYMRTVAAGRRAVEEVEEATA